MLRSVLLHGYSFAPRRFRYSLACREYPGAVLGSADELAVRELIHQRMKALRQMGRQAAKYPLPLAAGVGGWQSWYRE